VSVGRRDFVSINSGGGGSAAGSTATRPASMPTAGAPSTVKDASVAPATAAVLADKDSTESADFEQIDV